MVTTIQIDERLKAKLNRLKVHPRETYNELISRIINFPRNNKPDAESLTETIEIMSDPETIRDIAKGIEEYEKGRGIDFDKLRRELNLNV